jgi:N6-L-threonylcarbamoyladenine synthase
MDDPLLTLGIETSCDETAAAVVAGGRRVLSSVVASQVELHRKYGGVVPELAARRHIEALAPVVREALARSGAAWGDIGLVAATRGPGLPGALLVGLAAAKALAFSRGLPFVGVNHLAGHLYAHALAPAGAGSPEPVRWPAVGLVVSGSHTDLCLLPGPGRLRLLGGTRDDAAGEAFDKVARLLGLPYPGGPALERLARAGDATRIPFPRGMADSPCEFSFSGLKTAVATYLERHPGADPADVAAGFQAAAVDTLVTKAVAAARAHAARTLLVAGGVSANSALRAALAREAAAARPPIALRVPPLELCTDNAAMIAAAGHAAWRAGRRDGWDLDADPNLPLEL